HGYRATVKRYASGNWANLGLPGFSDGKVGACEMVLDASGNPYVCYTDSAHSNKITVKRYNGTAWIAVGAPGFSAGAVGYPSIAITSTNIPFVSYRDGGNGNKLTVMRFTGGAWNLAGAAGFSDGAVTYTSMAVEPTSNAALVAYADAAAGNKVVLKRFNNATLTWVTQGTTASAGGASFVKLSVFSSVNGAYVAYTDSANGNKLSVRRYLLSNWSDIGIGVSAGPVSDIDFVVNLTGQWQSYVSFRDAANGNKLSVMYHVPFQGWLYMGNAGFSDGPVKYTALAVDAGGFSVAYTDSVHRYKPAVKKFMNNTWTSLASAGGFVTTASYYFPMAIDRSGTPYLAYMDSTNNNRPTLLKYDGVNWVKVGTTGFPNNNVTYGAIDMGSDGTPYFAVSDYQNDVTVMKYNGTSWVNVGSPNISGAPVTWITVKIDKLGIPWIAFIRYTMGGYATVMKFNGSQWETVGDAVATENDIYSLSLNFDNNNNPYLGYVDGSTYGNTVYYYPTVKTLVGNTWEWMGFIDTESDYTSVAIAPDGTLYLAFKEFYYDGKAVVMKYNDNNNTWNYVGTPGISEGSIYGLSLTVDSSGTPYLAYLDETYGYRAVLKKFADTGWATVNTPGFSANQVLWDALSIAIDRSGAPHVAYNDGNGWAKMYGEQLAMASATKTDSIVPPNWKYFKNGCDLLATVKPGGASPISGTTRTKMWIDATQPNGYVKRHYEIVPANNTATATGTVTLYFTQADFAAYNTAHFDNPFLPVSPADSGGRASLRIIKRNGASTDSSGSPYTYTGNIAVIDPPDSAIVWNNAQARWEITIPVTGFGGFFVTTSSIIDFNICPASVHTISTGTAGASYQWQADTGSGYNNISNGGVYSGVTTNTLTTTGLSSTTHHGIRFRCLVNGVPEAPYAINFDVRWLGSMNNNWFNPGNWSGCGAVPDSGSFVIIPAGRPNYPVLNAHATIWGIRVDPGTTITIQTGAHLTILK
ncbi:MAG: hypothetical protein JNM68_03245, partial [Dinghuibacter sp.]|nr:hypothetical protein [Dinghuibacter sp.]